MPSNHSSRAAQQETLGQVPRAVVGCTECQVTDQVRSSSFDSLLLAWASHSSLERIDGDDDETPSGKQQQMFWILRCQGKQAREARFPPSAALLSEPSLLQRLGSSAVRRVQVHWGVLQLLRCAYSPEQYVTRSMFSC